jgi:hypothetical protein
MSPSEPSGPERILLTVGYARDVYRAPADSGQDKTALGTVTVGDAHTIAPKFWNNVTFAGCNVSSKLCCVQP